MSRMVLFGTLSFICTLIVTGCPVRPVYTDLALENDSGFRIRTLVNLGYPDSSLADAAPDASIGAKDWGYVGISYKLREHAGLTVFVVDFGYFERNWNKDGLGNTLEEDSVLARYHLDRAELDSLDWRLSYSPETVP